MKHAAYYRQRRHNGQLRSIGRQFWKHFSKHSCKGKKVYEDRASAQRAADYVWRRFKDCQFPYVCMFCKQFHLGHPIRERTSPQLLNALRFQLHSKLLGLLKQRR